MNGIIASIYNRKGDEKMWLTKFDLPDELSDKAKAALLELFTDSPVETAITAVRWLTFDYKVIPDEILRKTLEASIKLLEQISEMKADRQTKKWVNDIVIAIYIVGGDAATAAIKGCLSVDSVLKEWVQVYLIGRLNWTLPQEVPFNQEQKLQIILTALDSKHREVVKLACYRSSSYGEANPVLVKKLIKTAHRKGLKGTNLQAYGALADFRYSSNPELFKQVSEFLSDASARHQNASIALELLKIRANQY
jgi:hypothetical protein